MVQDAVGEGLLQDKHKQAKSEVHRRPEHSRRVRRRDGDATAADGLERQRSWRDHGRRVHACPRSGSRSDRCSAANRSNGSRSGHRLTFTQDTYATRVVTIVPGLGETGKSTAYVRFAQPRDRHRAGRQVQPVHRALLALHAPRLSRPLRARGRASSSARATAASTTSAGCAPAAPRCGRSTASTPASTTAWWRSGPVTRSTRELRRFSARDPGEPLDGIGQYLYPKRFSTSVLPKN